jgi:hypothetical protein
MKDAKGEVLPPAERDKQRGKIVLREVGTPPGGIIRTAFFSAIANRMNNQAWSAYNDCLATLNETRRLLNDLNYADLESERVFRLLDNAEDVHETDAAQRKLRLVQAQSALAEEEHQAELDRRRRARELGQHTTTPKRATQQDIEQVADELYHEIKTAYTKAHDGNLDEKDQAVLDEFLRVKNQIVEDSK